MHSEGKHIVSGAAQVLDYIKVDDFQGAESLQGHETRARVVEALKITSHTLQAQRSQEGTIVTVKDLINLPREASPRTPSRILYTCRSVINTFSSALCCVCIQASAHVSVHPWGPEKDLWYTRLGSCKPADLRLWRWHTFIHAD